MDRDDDLDGLSASEQDDKVAWYRNAEVAEKFRPTDRFFVWPQGDRLILKQVAPAHVTEIAAGAPDDDSQTTTEEAAAR